MSMDAHHLASFIWLVQEDIIRPNELPIRECFDTDTENSALVDRERVWVLDFEGRDARAGTVEAFLIVCKLLLREVEDGLMQRIIVFGGGCCGEGGGLSLGGAETCEDRLGGAGREYVGGLDGSLRL